VTRTTINGWTITRWGEAPDVDISGPDGEDWQIAGAAGEVDVHPEDKERSRGWEGDCAMTRTIPLDVLVAGLRMAGVIPGEHGPVDSGVVPDAQEES